MDYAKKKAVAEFLYAQPPGADLPSQKFKRGSRVKVDNLMPSQNHFYGGFVGIVEYTYAQQFGGTNIDSYSLLVLNENDKPVNEISWYRESQLTLLDGNTKEGLKIIELYEKEGLI